VRGEMPYRGEAHALALLGQRLQLCAAPIMDNQPRLHTALTESSEVVQCKTASPPKRAKAASATMQMRISESHSGCLRW
jgi:hypothetical protein